MALQFLKNKNTLFIILIIVLIHMIYFVLTLFWKNIYISDSYEYLNQAINLGKHLNWYCGNFNEQIDLDFFSRRPPVYGLFLFILKSIVKTDYFILFVQSILSIVNIYGVLRLLRYYKFNVSEKIIVLFTLVLYPSQLIYCCNNLLLMELYEENEYSMKINEIREYLGSIEDYTFKCSEEERIGYGIILNNKIEYAKLHVKGMINFFLDPGRFDLVNFAGIKEQRNVSLLKLFTKSGYWEVSKYIFSQPFPITLYLILNLLINVIMLASLLYLPFVKKINIDLKFFIFILILYLSFFTGPVGAMRFKVPLFPIILFTIPFLCF